MFSPEVYLLIFEEKGKDLRRKAVRHQLIKSVMLQRSGYRELVRKVVGWFGFQMVTWGLKLQHYSQGQRQTVIYREA